MPRPALVASLLVLTLAPGACGTTYVPAASPRASVAFEDARFVIYRDGRRYSAGGISGEAVQAVAGNPQAEAHARTYVRHMRTFVGLYLGGITFDLIGLGLSAGSPGITRDRFSSGLHIGGLVLALAGLGFAFTGQPRLWDAVSTYNDGLPR